MRCTICIYTKQPKPKFESDQHIEDPMQSSDRGVASCQLVSGRRHVATVTIEYSWLPCASTVLLNLQSQHFASLGNTWASPGLTVTTAQAPENACCVIMRLQKCLVEDAIMGRHDRRDIQRTLEGVLTHQFLSSRCLQYLKPDSRQQKPHLAVLTICSATATISIPTSPAIQDTIF